MMKYKIKNKETECYCYEITKDDYTRLDELKNR